MDSQETDPIIATLEDARRQFLALVDNVRPELHRYCTRMTGSVADGEDVVQDVLARAYYELSAEKEMPPLRPWLFRIAHNRAIDHWRHESHRATEPIDSAEGIADLDEREPENMLARSQAVSAALSYFMQLPPAPRGCVILKDVLDHSLEEIAGELDMTLPAVKSALHRGRAQLRELTLAATAQASLPPAPRTASPMLLRYISLFNARDWDAVRELLADDVRLDLVARHKLAGREAVGRYFTNYDKLCGWYLMPAQLEGREVVAIRRDEAATQPDYFVELSWRGERIVDIRDFYYVPYIVQEAALEPMA